MKRIDFDEKDFDEKGGKRIDGYNPWSTSPELSLEYMELSAPGVFPDLHWLRVYAKRWISTVCGLIGGF